jgi:hypothetical protein
MAALSPLAFNVASAMEMLFIVEVNEAEVSE